MQKQIKNLYDQYRLNLAKEIAKVAHFEQVYIIGVRRYDYFDFHVMGVFDRTKKSGHDIDTQIVALLHDVLEDGENISFKDLHKIFGPEITNSVIRLTRDKKEDYSGYIDILDSDIKAVRVKICDLEENISHCKDDNASDRAKTILLKKYQAALEHLKSLKL